MSSFIPSEPSGSRPTVMAIYFPNWHRYDNQDAWKGEGWTEWELVKTGQPRFPGHYQPFKPSWGYFDESDPKWAAKEIDLAADHGVDVFLFDWYWYSGVKIMEEALERGFLQASNRKRLKFALMWANHDWTDQLPAHYGPRQERDNWLPMRYSPRDLHRLIDYCAEHYFAESNYWRHPDGGLFLSIFDTDAFISGLGGPEKTRQTLEQIDRRLNARGLPSINWNAMSFYVDQLIGFKAAGFSSATSYNVPSAGTTRAEDKGIQPYAEVIKAHHRSWESFGKSGMDYFPVVTVGWDSTARCQKEVSWPFLENTDHPYWHVITGNTPKRFEQLCRDASQYLDKTPTASKVVMVNAWNEWTEGCFLLPEKRYGDAYLQAIRDVFGVAELKGGIGKDMDSRSANGACVEEEPVVARGIDDSLFNLR